MSKIILFFVLIGFTVNLHAQISYVASSTFIGSTGYVIQAGTNRILIVAISAECQDCDSQLNTVKLDGVGLTKIIGNSGGPGLNDHRLEVWYLDEAGLQTVEGGISPFDFTMSWTNAPAAADIFTHSSIFENVEQSTPSIVESTIAGSATTGVTLGNSMSVLSGQISFYTALTRRDNGTSTTDAGYTELTDNEVSDNTGNHGHSTNYKAISSGGSETPSSLWSGVGGNQIVGIVLQEVVVLPIELILFNAELLPANTVQLNWVTASEINNNYFMVERSKDGLNWDVLTIVDGAGNSSINLYYEFIDTEVLPGTNYYRLQQVDFDGKYSYSKIVTTQFSETYNEVMIYPNPFASVTTLTFNNTDNLNHTFMLFDGQGRLVRTLIGITAGKVIIERKNLINGLYFYQLRNDRQVHASGKLILE